MAPRIPRALREVYRPSDAAGIVRTCALPSIALGTGPGLAALHRRAARHADAGLAGGGDAGFEFFKKNRPGEIISLRIADASSSKDSMPSAITVIPSASLRDSIARKIPWLRGRKWMSVINERSILISSAVISANADSDE